VSRWINALYDTRAEAEVARARLVSEIGIDKVSILSKTNESELTRLDLSATDRQKYSDGLRRGAVLLAAEASGKKDADRIRRILEEAARHGVPGQAFARAGELDGRTIDEQRVPLVEEELRIGKREVARGGARVQSHVREVPAEASVTLKQERLEVGRRPAERTLSDADLHSGGLLKPRVVEISEMREEAVVTKEAFVREEVVVSKSVEERVETVRDTVRRTEVDVDEYRSADRPR
jgi:uncharacterized protein (TIGR02271 family)